MLQMYCNELITVCGELQNLVSSSVLVRVGPLILSHHIPPVPVLTMEMRAMVVR